MAFRFGVVGAVGRGGSFRGALQAIGAEVHAVCDLNEAELEKAKSDLGAKKAFTDFEQMLDDEHLDAVLIGTPMQFHVPQSIIALERGVHVLSEVTAGVSVEECKDLFVATEKSDALYMLSENYCYIKGNVFVKALVEAGLFGEVYYAEGEYLHDVTDLGETTPWRRHWQLGIRGITYCTHSLGPILQWFHGDRVVKVCCEDSGSHYKDPNGDSYASDSSVMLCKTAKGRLIKLRVDLVSARPHAMTNYQLQGSDGAYESGRGNEAAKIWLRSESLQERWLDFDTLMISESVGGKVLPERWYRPNAEAMRSGHGGGDYFVLDDFICACRGEIECPINIHQAMDMTLPGLISQQSILQEGQWLDVPDSRQWVN
tara:strand:+ start:4092 stop:5207 length:1116 start_codon:yes stop_codon:yes gene_type:complete